MELYMAGLAVKEQEFSIKRKCMVKNERQEKSSVNQLLYMVVFVLLFYAII